MVANRVEVERRGLRPPTTSAADEAAEGTTLVYQCALPLSCQTLTFAADLLRAHLKKIGSRWRKLRPRKIALIVLATLRHDHRLADLAGGNGVSASTIHRWTWEIVGLLAARSATMLKIPSSSIAALPPRHLLPAGLSPPLILGTHAAMSAGDREPALEIGSRARIRGMPGSPGAHRRPGAAPPTSTPGSGGACSQADPPAESRIRDDRLGEPGAQPGLGVGVLAGPPLADRQPVRVQVMRDQRRAWLLQVRRPGRQPLGDLGQLGRQPGLGRRLPEPPLPVLGERRTPRITLGLRRVHQDPALHLHHHPGSVPDGLAGVTGQALLAARCPGLGYVSGTAGRPAETRLCWICVDLSFRQRGPRHRESLSSCIKCRLEGLTAGRERWWSGAGSNCRPSAFQKVCRRPDHGNCEPCQPRTACIKACQG